jgi:hypothetical protein
MTVFLQNLQFSSSTYECTYVVTISKSYHEDEKEDAI